MNNYPHKASLTPLPNKIIRSVGVNLVMDAVENKYSLLSGPRCQTVCRMSISVCPLGMLSTDKHSICGHGRIYRWATVDSVSERGW